MQNIWIYSLLSVLLISLVSLIGIVTLSLRVSFLKKIVIFLVSLAAGALLGDVFLHLLPELIEHGHFGVHTGFIILGAIVFAFIMEKILHWRHCHIPTGTQWHQHPFAIMNLVGDSMHNLIDGLIIGASYLVSIEVGIATTIAVLLHEIPQEMGDFGVLVHGWFSVKQALLVNFATALTAFVGVIIALVLGSYVEWVHEFLVPIAIGMFIYIAWSDLIPEMHKETNRKQSFWQLTAFLLGIGLMALLLIEHSH
jgi:zinc and cadmium transporter